jgi:hypothetical protein
VFVFATTRGNHFGVTRPAMSREQEAALIAVLRAILEEEGEPECNLPAMGALEVGHFGLTPSELSYLKWVEWRNMNTTQLFAELLITGTGVVIWLGFLIASGLRLSIQDITSNMSVLTLAPVIGIAYVLGIIVDRIGYDLFSGLEARNRDQVITAIKLRIDPLGSEALKRPADTQNPLKTGYNVPFQCVCNALLVSADDFNRWLWLNLMPVRSGNGIRHHALGWR